jgi:hypothetical protein
LLSFFLVSPPFLLLLQSFCDVLVSTNNNNYYNYSGCTFAMNKISYFSTKKR